MRNKPTTCQHVKERHTALQRNVCVCVCVCARARAHVCRGGGTSTIFSSSRGETAGLFAFASASSCFSSAVPFSSMAASCSRHLACAAAATWCGASPFAFGAIRAQRGDLLNANRVHAPLRRHRCCKLQSHLADRCVVRAQLRRQLGGLCGLLAHTPAATG